MLPVSLFSMMRTRIVAHHRLAKHNMQLARNYAEDHKCKCGKKSQNICWNQYAQADHIMYDTAQRVRNLVILPEDLEIYKLKAITLAACKENQDKVEQEWQKKIQSIINYIPLSQIKNARYQRWNL